MTTGTRGTKAHWPDGEGNTAPSNPQPWGKRSRWCNTGERPGAAGLSARRVPTRLRAAFLLRGQTELAREGDRPDQAAKRGGRQAKPMPLLPQQLRRKRQAKSSEKQSPRSIKAARRQGAAPSPATRHPGSAARHRHCTARHAPPRPAGPDTHPAPRRPRPRPRTAASPCRTCSRSRPPGQRRARSSAGCGQQRLHQRLQLLRPLRRHCGSEPGLAL